MPVSFWIFLIICIASFVVAIDDHSAELEEFRELNGIRKWWKGLKIFMLWFVCVGSFIGTLVLGRESLQGNKQDAQREKQYEDVTNQLDQVTDKYNEATNDLAETKARLASIRPLKQRLIDCLNLIDPQIMPSLKNGTTTFQEGDVPEYEFNQLAILLSEPGSRQFCASLMRQGGVKVFL